METSRLTLGKMQNPVRGFLHGSAAVASAVGTIYLIAAGAGNITRQLALAIFGMGLITLYTVSSLYHSIPWTMNTKRLMQRVDHSAIFVLIAASYTPFAAVVLDGWLRWTTLAAAWSIALVGIGQHIFFPRDDQTLSVVLHVTLGWLAVFIAVPIVQRLGLGPFAGLFIGGVFYTVGMVILVTNRPRLWPRVFSSHELFHVFVVAGSAMHFFVAARYVAQYG